MMMTQPFPAHQGMPQHPGLPPGHPMAQAQHPNMGVQAPGMVQQMHPGVSAAGPQVSQPGPMMAGMPPGATTGPGGPVANAHALQHLNPAQAQAQHLLQQQPYGLNAPNNNQMLQQQQQHVLARQRMLQQQQQQLAQQQHHGGGIPVSMPAGTQGMSQAQLSAIQNSNMRGPVNMMHFPQQMPHVPPNIQQQQQFMAMQQAAQAAAQAQAQAAAHVNNQQGQHTPQQRAAVPPQSVTPQPQQGPQAPQGSGTPSQQSNPPQHATPQPPSHQGSQPPTQPTPNPQHQQISQVQQAQQPSQQQAQPNQQQQQAQLNQSQAPNGQQQPVQQQHQAQMGQQQQAMSTPEQLKMQQQFLINQQRAAANMNPTMPSTKGLYVHYVNSYFETLSNFQSNGEDADLLFWQEVVNKYYNTTFHMSTGQPWGVLRQGVLTPGTGSKSFEVNATILPRYYVTLFNNGIRRIQTHMEATQEFTCQGNFRVVYSPKTSFIYWFSNDCQLFMNGSLKVLLNPEAKFDLVDISVTGFREYIPRSLLQPQEPTEQKQSPRVSKTGNKRAQQKQPPPPPIITPPESLVNDNGIPTSVQFFLEIAEPLSSMTSLIFHSAGNPQKSAADVLREVTTMMAQQGMNAALQQAQQGQRTPSINGPSQFASPLVGQMGLPGAQASPHLGNSAHPSPAQSQLMGPGMIPHQNQAAMNANGNQGTSANTSPSVSNKRRRASTVKTEGEDGGAEINGTGTTGASKVKASPRVGGKRQKGTA